MRTNAFSSRSKSPYKFICINAYFATKNKIVMLITGGKKNYLSEQFFPPHDSKFVNKILGDSTHWKIKHIQEIIHCLVLLKKLCYPLYWNFLENIQNRPKVLHTFLNSIINKIIDAQECGLTEILLMIESFFKQIKKIVQKFSIDGALPSNLKTFSKNSR